jgi:branched-chain amino acid transport system permease protein
MSDPAVKSTLERRRRWMGLAVTIIVIAALPLVFGQSAYWRSLMIICALNVILALSLNLILGYAGQLNLGHSGFYAVGAYMSTVLVSTSGWNFWLAMLAGSAAAGLLGILLALFAGRLRGHYLGIASLGFGVITYQVLMNWQSVTQGPLGIYGILPPPAIHLGGWTIDFSKQINLFYLIAGIAVLVFIVLGNILRSPIGETLTAIREDEVSAASLGIDIKKWKIFAFGLGAAIAGLAGAFYPGFVGTLVPDAFFITESFSMLAMVIVGGAGTMSGPVIGALALTLLPEVLRGIGDLRLLVYGLALTLVVLFMPGGIVQAAHALRVRWNTARGRSAQGEHP